MAKKVKPLAAPLPEDSDQVLERVSKEYILRDPSKIGHTCTKETLIEFQISLFVTESPFVLLICKICPKNTKIIVLFVKNLQMEQFFLQMGQFFLQIEQ